jgi:hypothetical protein
MAALSRTIGGVPPSVGEPILFCSFASLAIRREKATLASGLEPYQNKAHQLLI